LQEFKKAEKLLSQFRGDKYHFGQDILGEALKDAAKMGRKAILFRGSFPGSDAYVDMIVSSLKQSGTILNGVFKGARPNSPQEDVRRMVASIDKTNPDFAITFGGGSNIDAAKAALVLFTFGGDLDDYFGVGRVSAAIKNSSKKLLPHLAIQTIAGSGAHLTKYSNITDTARSQKKLIIDEAVVPDLSIFDYSVTYNTPIGITSDGALDGFTHLIEVLYGSEGKPEFKKVSGIASTGIELIVKYLPGVIDRPDDNTSRNALCYGTDLGGYAIMIGGTNGAHLTSFSLVDILSHGRACAIMEPYYSVLFAPAINDSLRLVGNIFKKYGYSRTDFNNISGRQLGLSVASAMIKFSKKIGLPTTLKEVEGFSKIHIERALKAAKDPALKSKLENMPIPLSLDMIDIYMKKVLESAASGDLSIIENIQG
jgi:alcohol dehydrogenase